MYIYFIWNYYYMALPPYIDKNQKEWLYKVTRKTSSQPVRDTCILSVFFLTPCTTLEINRIQISDVLCKNGSLKRDFILRGHPAFNWDERPVYLTNKKLKESLNEYINFRVDNKIGLGDHPDYYRGLAHEEPLFLTNKGGGFSIVKKVGRKGKVSYHSDALNRLVKTLMSKSGIEGPSILSGRRTFAVNLKRNGIDISYIHFLLGNKTLKTTQKIFISDPVDMAAIVADVY